MKSKLIAFGSFACPAVVILVCIAVLIMPFVVNLEDEIPVSFRPAVVMVMVLLLLSVIGVWFFIVYDIIHVTQNSNVPEKARVGWICAILLLNVFVIPVYWMKYIKQNHRTGQHPHPLPPRINR